MNFLYASNDGYACHLAASLYSLLETNTQVPELDIYVLSVGMCEQYQEQLKALAGEFKRTLTVVELGDLKERFPYEIDTRGFDISAMGRLFAPEVLPETVERILYLDCDTIVRGDVTPLYEMDLQGNPAGMVMEPTVYQEMKDSIGLTREDPYFNSGVILMDLRQWRRKRVLQNLLDFYGACSGNLFACDQDTLNGALAGKIASLPPKYNFFTNYRYFHYHTLKNLCPAYEQVGKEAFKEAKRSPVILHYLGDERPWIAGNHNHYRKFYEEALSKTAWKDTPKVEGKRLYMHLWWCFNQMTRICPPLRIAISRKMGMKIIDGRKKSRESAEEKVHG